MKMMKNAKGAVSIFLVIVLVPMLTLGTVFTFLELFSLQI